MSLEQQRNGRLRETSPGSHRRDIEACGSSTCARPPTRASASCSAIADARAEPDRHDAASGGRGHVIEQCAPCGPITGGGRCVAARRPARTLAARAEQRLDLAEHEEPARRERSWNLRTIALLRLAVEVDQHVAADDEIVRPPGGGSRSRSRRSKRTSARIAGHGRFRRRRDVK